MSDTYTSWCVSQGSGSIEDVGKDPLEGKKSRSAGWPGFCSDPQGFPTWWQVWPFVHPCYEWWVTKSPRTEPEPAVFPALLGSLVGSTSIIAPTSVSSQPPNTPQSPTKVILCCTMGRKHASVSLDCTCFSSTGQNSMNS